jgi:hypothetical protein
MSIALCSECGCAMDTDDDPNAFTYLGRCICEVCRNDPDVIIEVNDVDDDPPENMEGNAALASAPEVKRNES